MNDSKSLWEDLKATVLATELDVLKNSNGNVLAGIRARRGLRMIKRKLSVLIDVLKQNDKQRKEERKLSRNSE